MNEASSDRRKAAVAAISSGPSQTSDLVLGRRRRPWIPPARASRTRRRSHRRVDEARAHRVHPDTPSGVVDGHALGEDDHAALRGAVDAATGGALEALDAGDGHHRTPDAAHHRLGEHGVDGVLGHQVRPGQVDPQDPVPLLRCPAYAPAPPLATPAEFTTPSIRPPKRTAAAMRSTTESSSATSAGWNSQDVADDPGGAAAGSTMSDPTTSAPSSMSRVAHAQPMPDAAPVTTMHFP